MDCIRVVYFVYRFVDPVDWFLCTRVVEMALDYVDTSEENEAKI